MTSFGFSSVKESEDNPKTWGVPEVKTLLASAVFGRLLIQETVYGHSQSRRGHEPEDPVPDDGLEGHSGPRDL